MQPFFIFSHEDSTMRAVGQYMDYAEVKRLQALDNLGQGLVLSQEQLLQWKAAIGQANYPNAFYGVHGEHPYPLAFIGEYVDGSDAEAQLFGRDPDANVFFIFDNEVAQQILRTPH